MIFTLIREYYNEAAGETLTTGAVVSYQSFGDVVRFNPHWHCIILEGGIDEDGGFTHVPVKDISGLTELFWRKVIRYFE